MSTYDTVLQWHVFCEQHPLRTDVFPVAMNAPSRDEILTQAGLLALELEGDLRYVVASDGRILYFNGEAARWIERLFGRAPKIGENLLDYAANTSAHLLANLERCGRGETVTSVREVPYPRGEVVTWRIHYHPIHVGEVVAGVLVSAIALESRDRPVVLEGEPGQAIEPAALLPAFLDAVPTGMLLLGLDGMILVANQRAAEILGAPTGELLGADLERLFPDVHSEFESGQRRVLSMTNLKGEHLRIGYTSSIFTMNEETRGFVVVFQDITELEQLRKTVRQTMRIAALGNFVAKISHDLRNPLFGIQSVVQLLSASAPAGDRDLLEAVKNEVRRMLAMLEDLLAFGSTRPAARERVDLCRIVDEALSALKLSTPRAAEVTPCAMGGILVTGNNALMHRAVVNILQNALRATREGGSVSVECGAEAGNGWLRVADTGVGITPADMRHIFEPFFSTFADGTGLGLPIAKKAVEDFGGELTVESEPGAGTTVTLKLPRTS